MLTDEEKGAIRVLVLYFDTCKGECATCPFDREKGRCLPAHAKISKKVLKL